MSAELSSQGITRIVENVIADYDLHDEDGNELNFSLLGTLEHEGSVYKALIPVDEDGNEESEEYVILKCGVDDDGEEILETIEDDEEFDKIADIFDDEFADIFYDSDEDSDSDAE